MDLPEIERCVKGYRDIDNWDIYREKVENNFRMGGHKVNTKPVPEGIDPSGVG